jgi:MFS transporter (putative signal transducer)
MTDTAIDTTFAPSSAATTRTHEYLALAVMYFAQGLPAGLAFDALATLIRHGGHSVAAVGWAGLAFLPWAFKFFWAGAIDNACHRHGHARIVLVTQAIVVVACIALAPFSPASHLPFAVAGVVLLNTICATQDIATNAYAVARLQGRHAGAANAIQVAAFIGGMLAGGGGLLIVHTYWGWSGAMLAMAALMALLYLPLAFDRRWHEGLPAHAPRAVVRLRDVRLHRDLVWALVVALSFKFASTAAATLTKPWLIDRGFDLAAAGRLQVFNLVLTALGGVLLGVPLVRRLGNRRAVVVAAVFASVVLGAAFLLERGGVRDVAWFYAAFGVQAVFEGALYVAIWALFMNWASPERPGTDYTAMQCCESLTNALAAGAIGGLGQSLGYANAFAGAWAAGVLVFVLLALAVPRLRLAGEARA